MESTDLICREARQGLLSFSSRYLFRYAAVIGLLAPFANGHVRGQEPPEQVGLLTPAQKAEALESFDRAWALIRDGHWDSTLGGLDWAAVRDEFRPRVEQARSAAEARALLRQMVGRLKQSHFEILPPAEADDAGADPGIVAASQDGACGLEVRVIDGRPIVTRVAEGSPAERAGVRAGWVIRRVAGSDPAPALRRIEAESRGSSLLDYRMAWSIQRHFYGKPGDEVAVEFLDGSDRPVGRTVRLDRRPGRMVENEGSGPRLLEIRIRSIGSDVGYLALNTWYGPGPLLGAARDAAHQFRGRAGLIIDLRGSRGGLIRLAPEVASYFTRDPGGSLGLLTTRGSRRVLTIRPESEVFRGRVAILVDGLTRSTSEIFAVGLKELGRARVFGSRTAGAVAGSNVERLPNGDRLEFVVARFTTTKGADLEGIGVEPDRVVRPSRRDLLAGRDPALDEAVAWIRSE